MNIIHQPCFNVDTMEGAVMHMLAVCDTPPAPAINAFVQKLAILRNRKVPEDYGMNSIISLWKSIQNSRKRIKQFKESLLY